MHNSVLLSEAINELVGDKNGIYVDGTFGGGGHTSRLLGILGPKGKLLALDWDTESFQGITRDMRVSGFLSNFSDVTDILEKERLGSDSVDGILLDLGLSNSQLFSDTRGFSFKREGFLRG